MAEMYEIIHVNELWLANHKCSDGEPLITVQKMCQDEGYINVPDLSYGCKADETDLNFDVTGQDQCVPGPYALPAPEIYFIKDCIIWTKYGLITVGNYLLKESTSIFPKHLVSEVQFEGHLYHETHATLRFSSAPFAQVEDAVSILSGFDENYFHYIMMFLTKLDPSVFYAPQWKSTKRKPFLIAPEPIADYQAESLTRLLNIFNAPCIKLEEKSCIHVRNLAFPVVLGFGGRFPHPIIKRSLSILQNSFVSGRMNSTTKKIYVSRRDSKNRKMENEPEIESIVSEYGFEIISLTGLHISEQIKIFAAATHIIAPHGAGLTNLVFCKDATNLLEIHMAPYINWCYRRLAGVYGLKYGCIWARAVIPTASIHDAIYHLEPSALLSVLTDPMFLAPN